MRDIIPDHHVFPDLRESQNREMPVCAFCSPPGVSAGSGYAYKTVSGISDIGMEGSTRTDGGDGVKISTFLCRMIMAVFVIGWLIACGGKPDLPPEEVPPGAPGELKGLYLGQRPPGEEPEIFAPGIVADIYREHSAAFFSPDGRELFWTRVMNQGGESRLDIVMHMKMEEGIWKGPELAPFSVGTMAHIHCISPDGNRIYFNAMGPSAAEGKLKVSSWIVDKAGDHWGPPRPNRLIPDWKYPYVLFQETRSGNIYFQTNHMPEVSHGIGFLCSELKNGRYQSPRALGKSINSKYLDYAYRVDPDEKFVVFASERPGGFSGLDLYISFRREDGSWGAAVNLGPRINCPEAAVNSWPTLSPDKKYLFFVRAMQPFKNIREKRYSYARIKEISLSAANGYGKIYWVSASFIEKLDPDNPKRTGELK